MIKHFIIIVISFLFSASAFSQNGSISGTVKDSTGFPLPDINVKIKGSYSATGTDTEGKYILKNINPGEYTVQVSSIGYKTVEYTGIKVRKGEDTKLDITLSTTSYEVGEEILVVGDRPLLDLEQTESKHVLDSKDIQSKIVDNVIDVIALQPGVVKQDESLFIRGGRANDNSYLLDGVSVQDPLSGTGFGLEMSSNSLEQVEVITGGYNAEYGQALSGVVNVKTKAGSYDRYNLNLSLKKDNLGFNKNWKTTFNTDLFEINLSGPEPITKYFLPIVS